MDSLKNLPKWVLIVGGALVGAVLFYLAWKFLFGKGKKSHDHHHKPSKKEEGDSEEGKAQPPANQPSPKSPHAVLYFSKEGCPHCRGFDPVWEQLKQGFKDTIFDVHVAASDPETFKKSDVYKLFNEFGVTGCPTIVHYNMQTQKPTTFSGGRNLKALTDFLKGLGVPTSS